MSARSKTRSTPQEALNPVNAHPDPAETQERKARAARKATWATRAYPEYQDRPDALAATVNPANLASQEMLAYPVQMALQDPLALPELRSV